MSDRLPVRLYRLLNGAARDEVLNDAPASADAPMAADGMAAPALAASLKRAVNDLKALAFADGRVHYARLAGSAELRAYLEQVRLLRTFDPARLADDVARRAFWINLYNALIVHAVIHYGVRESIQEVRGVFSRAAYRVGGQRLSADDIEHGILRANAGHPLTPGGHFAPHDPRRAWCVSALDPRVHFTLVCAARSCPPIAVYDAERLDSQLERAAFSFINGGGVELHRPPETIALSRLFSWYAADFGGRWFGLAGRAALLAFVAPYLSAPDDVQWVRERGTRLKVEFLPYDWKLNT